MPFFLAWGTRLKVKIQEKQKAENISSNSDHVIYLTKQHRFLLIKRKPLRLIL